MKASQRTEAPLLPVKASQRPKALQLLEDRWVTLGSSPTRPIEHVPLLGTREHLPRVVDEMVSRDRIDVCPE